MNLFEELAKEMLNSQSHKEAADNTVINGFKSESDAFIFTVLHENGSIKFNYKLKQEDVATAKLHILKAWKTVMIMTKFPMFGVSFDRLGVKEGESIIVVIEDDDERCEFTWNDDKVEFEQTGNVGFEKDAEPCYMDPDAIEDDDDLDDLRDFCNPEDDDDDDDKAEDDPGYVLMSSKINDASWIFSYSVTDKERKENVITEIIDMWKKKLTDHPVDRRVELHIEYDGYTFDFIWNSEHMTFEQYTPAAVPAKEKQEEIKVEVKPIEDEPHTCDIADIDGATVEESGKLEPSKKLINTAEDMMEVINSNYYPMELFNRIMSLDFINYMVAIKKAEGKAVSFTIRLEMNDSDYLIFNSNTQLFKEFVTGKYGYSNVTATYDCGQSTKNINVVSITFIF